MGGSACSPGWSQGRRVNDSYFPSTSVRTTGTHRRRGSATPVDSLMPNATTPQMAHLSLRDLGPIGSGEGSDLDGGAPPSPSTLTDIILTLHASLYGVKRSADEIRQVVQRYYEGDAAFDTPLVSVHGRNNIIDQFILGFAFPAVDIRSELRDVICSDFEFDGTRAGIIDHTITITLFPTLFQSRSQFDPGVSTSGATFGQGSVTPHPFANYTTPVTGDEGAHPRRGAPGSTTPVSSWPSKPAHTYAQSSWGLRTRTPTTNEPKSANASRQPSDSALTINDEEVVRSPLFGTFSSMSVESPTADMPAYDARPGMPMDAGMPHWSASGLGRSTVWVLLGNFLSPGRALRTFFSVELRLLSRLEFNEDGRIVHHEDSWSLRELVDGLFPFLSVGTLTALTSVSSAAVPPGPAYLVAHPLRL